jgi:transcriptional regulator with XRE-family HTH domain
MKKETYAQKIWRLRVLRSRSGLSLKLVARQLGRTRSWLNQLELDRFRTTDEVLRQIELTITNLANAVQVAEARDQKPVEVGDLRLPRRRCPSRSKRIAAKTTLRKAPSRGLVFLKSECLSNVEGARRH